MRRHKRVYDWLRNKSFGTQQRYGLRLKAFYESMNVTPKRLGDFLGIMGQRKKHIVLSQNSFQFSNGFFDIDYTAIPTDWANEITVIAAHVIEDYEVDFLVKSFMMGRRHSRVAQRRVTNHG